jgi:cystathionine gamma-synthase
MESWLLLRSLRTFSLRIVKQSKTATVLAQWFNALAATPEGQEYEGVKGGLISKVWHGSLQGLDEDGFDAARQNEGGWSPCFSILASRITSTRVRLISCLFS